MLAFIFIYCVSLLLFCHMEFQIVFLCPSFQNCDFLHFCEATLFMINFKGGLGVLGFVLESRSAVLLAKHGS